jgi:pimeloyl-ACP methyl ester carboxylesterase
MSRALYGISLAGGGYTFTPSVTANNEAFSIIYPRIRPNQGAKQVLCFLHGSNGSARQGGSGGYWETLATYLADVHGYYCVSIDAGSNGNIASSATNPDTWGNNVAMLAMDAFFKWASQGISTGTSTATAAATITDTTQNWLTNVWTGHTITAGGKTGVIQSNTPTVITLSANWTGGTPAQPSTYTITQHFSDIMPFGNTTKIGLVAVSMGGWIAKNWASRNTSKVSCIVDITGVVDDTIIYTGFASGIDYAYGPAAPAAPTISGTAGATTYNYKIVPVSAMGDGPPSAASTNFSGPLPASLGASPTTVNWVQPVATTSAQVITGYKILRSIGAAAYTNIGSVGAVATFQDNVTGNPGGSAYTQQAANGTSRTLGAYGVNGRNASPSYDPTNATNLTAGLKAIPLQYWWTANDGATSTASGVPGTVNTEVQTYATAYGANISLQEIPGDPVHASAMSSISASSSSLATIAAFINTYAP